MDLTIKGRKISYKETDRGCWLCTSHKAKDHGYPVIKVAGHVVALSRLVYMAFNGEIPIGYVIRHNCDNPECINPNHLCVGTHSDNVHDRVIRGRSAIGENNGRSKLTEQIVISIYNDKKSSNRSLARKYSVDPTIIRRIKNGKLWKNVIQKYNERQYSY